MNTNALTFTRFLAAIYVVILHFGREVFPFNIEFLQTFFSHGATAVSYFFYLSGFVLAIAYYKRTISNKLDIRNFFVNRFSRLYPIYFFALILLCFIIIYFWKKPIDNIEFVLNASLLQAWNNEYALTLNYPGWSLSVEVFLYLCFPFVFKKIIDFELKKAFFLTSIIWIVSQLLSFKYGLDVFPPIHFATFLFGIITGLFVKKESKYLIFFKENSNLFLIISAIGIILILATDNIIINHGHNGLLVPLYILLTLSLIYAKNFITKLFSTKPLIILGEVSYGIYILQYPSLFVLRYINDKSGKLFYVNATNEFYFHLIFLIIFSIACYYILEIPSKNFLRKRLSKKSH